MRPKYEKYLPSQCFATLNIRQKISPETKTTTKPPLSKNVDQKNRNNNGHEQCTSTQASEDQQHFVFFLVDCRRTHLLYDQKHQQSPRRGLEGTHLLQIS